LCDRLSKRNLAINNLLTRDAVSLGGHYPVFHKYVLPSSSVSGSPRTAAVREIGAYIGTAIFGLFNPKDEDATIFRNVGNYSSNDRACNPGRPESS
jgi:hypothetical protein